MANGQVETVNILTATPVSRVALQRVAFFGVRLPPWLLRSLFKTGGTAAALKRLNFLHSGGWLALDRFPKFEDEQHDIRREPWYAPRWMLFAGTFNQGREEYIQAFLNITGGGVHLLWGESIGYPGFPSQETRYATDEWKANRIIESQYTFRAYPHVATDDVRSAIRLEREAHSLAEGAAAVAGFPGVAPPPAAVAGQQNRRRLQHVINHIDTSAAGGTINPSTVTATGMSRFVAALPIRPGEESALAQTIQTNRFALDGWLEGSGVVHFARLVIVDKEGATRHPRRRRKVTLRTSWLLFVVDFDGAFELDEDRRRRQPYRKRKQFKADGRDAAFAKAFADLFERLGVGPFGSVLPHMAGIRPSATVDGLRDWVWRGVVRRLLYFGDYPDVTLEEIRSALAARRSRLANL